MVHQVIERRGRFGSRNYGISRKMPGFQYKMTVEYELSIKKHIKTRFSVKFRVKFVLYLAFVLKIVA